MEVWSKITGFNEYQVSILGRFILEEDARDAYLKALKYNNLMNRYASNNSI